MKISMKQTLVAVALPIALVASPVMAANEGQIEGGNIYRIANLTSGADFANPASATGCQVLRYKVRIHNPGPGVLSNVTVKAVVPAGTAMSNTSTVTISSPNADPASTTATATVNFNTPLSLTYVNGSTQLLDENGNVISNLPDGILAGGVNIGTVGVSIQQKRFVQFQEKTNCSTPTPTPTPTPTTPVLPDTGAGTGVGLMAALGTGLVATMAYYYRRSRMAVAQSLRDR